MPLMSVGSHLLDRVRNRLATVCERPVIVLGNQKSGTSAIAHLLADFAGLSKTIDIPALWPPTGVEVMHGRRAFADVVRRNKRSFSTELIKEPMMTFFAEQVRDRFPEARYVFIVRHPLANIRSILDRRGLPGDLDRLSAEHHQRIGPKRITVDAEAWGIESANYVELLARRWVRAVHAHGIVEDRAVLVRYENFRADKLGCIAGLADRLGLDRANDISDRLDVQYQPAGRHSGARWGAFFGERNLEMIRSVCGPMMKRLGYE